MIKQLLHKILALSLAVLVMFSTLSFSVEKHYCSTNLVDIDILFSGEKTQKDCFGNELINKTESSCCNDVVEFVEGQELIQNNNVKDYQYSDYQFFSALSYKYNYIFVGLPKSVRPNDDYAPPILVEDRTIKHQIFLI